MRDLLEEVGIAVELVTDDAPGVPQGVYEVRVPALDAARAEAIIAANPEPPEDFVDPSGELDAETIFNAMGTTAQIEALAIRGVLESAGIPSYMVNAPMYPNLRFIVRVPKSYAAQARQALEEARSAGPLAAEMAELESEASGETEQA